MTFYISLPLLTSPTQENVVVDSTSVSMLHDHSPSILHQFASASVDGDNYTTNCYKFPKDFTTCHSLSSVCGMVAVMSHDN